MSENNYKVKCGKGFAISSQLKIRVLNKININIFSISIIR
jgi:hypothetical protein